MRSDPFDETPDRELAVRSAAVLAVGFGLVLSAIAGALLWLVFSFPVGAAKDIADQAVKVALFEKCSEASGTTTTTPPSAGATTTTLPLPCSVRP